MALVVEMPTRARVAVRGPDARAFLHRLSTQHVKELQPGDGRLNVLPTDKGRIVDLVLHLDRGDDGVLLVGSPGRGPALYAWLDRYLFSEKVELADLSTDGTCAEVFGADVADVAGGGALARWSFRAEAGGVVRARTFDRVDRDGRVVPCVVVIGPALPAGQRLSEDEGEAARIAAGVPGHAHELVDAFNPLDLGLHDAIHWNKGCYIGQEVIARLDTYQKQSKRLVALTSPGAPPAGAAIVGEGGAVAGNVTSVARVAWGDGLPNALGVARLPSLPAAVEIRVEGAGGTAAISATATAPATAQQPHD